jgi:hypothetical protein
MALILIKHLNKQIFIECQLWVKHAARGSFLECEIQFWESNNRFLKLYSWPQSITA